MPLNYRYHALRLAAAALPLMLGACAGLTVEGVGNDDQTTDEKARGVRFYQEAPFLFIYPDGQGGTAAEIRWLPDTRQVMSAKPYALLASNETTMEFVGSALTSMILVTDETAVVKASLEALGKVMLAANTAGEDKGDQTAPVPRLYRIIVNGDGGVVGLGTSQTLDVHGMSFAGK
ncbi:MAG TPA: hypothetical protein VIV63_04940 [Steroidobacteraceae bacterium]